KEERSNNLIIFIDELDRAKPNFALRTIEMFHHLQDSLPTHIVYSVDMNQLRSIIKHYYGYEYNVEIFTHKVFDEVIELKKLSRKDIEYYIDNQIRKVGTSFNIEKIRNYIIKHLKLNHIESLRTINKMCENVIGRLSKGYFKSINSSFETGYYYYLGNEGYHVLWGYVELIIVLETYSLNEPIKIYEFSRGENIKELLNYILDQEDRSLNKNLGDLIEKSFNYGKSQEKHKTYSELSEHEMIIGLKRLFVPNDKEYERESVFAST